MPDICWRVSHLQLNHIHMFWIDPQIKRDIDLFSPIGGWWGWWVGRGGWLVTKQHTCLPIIRVYWLTNIVVYLSSLLTNQHTCPSIRIYWPTNIPTHLPGFTYQPTHLPTYQPTYLPTYLSGSRGLLTNQHCNLLTYPGLMINQHTCLPKQVYWPTNLPAYLYGLLNNLSNCLYLSGWLTNILA